MCVDVGASGAGGVGAASDCGSLSTSGVTMPAEHQSIGLRELVCAQERQTSKYQLCQPDLSWSVEVLATV